MSSLDRQFAFHFLLGLLLPLCSLFVLVVSIKPFWQSPRCFSNIFSFYDDIMLIILWIHIIRQPFWILISSTSCDCFVPSFNVPGVVIHSLCAIIYGLILSLCWVTNMLYVLLFPQITSASMPSSFCVWWWYWLWFKPRRFGSGYKKTATIIRAAWWIHGSYPMSLKPLGSLAQSWNRFHIIIVSSMKQIFQVIWKQLEKPS